jgi:hypothetical protein
MVGRRSCGATRLGGRSWNYWTGALRMLHALVLERAGRGNDRNSTPWAPHAVDRLVRAARADGRPASVLRSADLGTRPVRTPCQPRRRSRSVSLWPEAVALKPDR